MATKDSFEIIRVAGALQATTAAVVSGVSGISDNEASSRLSAWENPDWSLLDDRRGTLPVFPLETLPIQWQEWASRAAAAAGVPVDYVILPLLAICSSLIGNSRRIQAASAWSEPLSLWTGVVGYSGTGKTPGLGVSLNVLAQIERARVPTVEQARREHKVRAQKARANFKKWQQDAAKGNNASMPAEAEAPGPFVAPRFYTNDATIEMVGVLLGVSPRGLLIVRDELSGIFANLNRYSTGGSDRPFWLESWNGKPYSIDRIGRAPITIPSLLVGITGGFQPDKLAATFSGDDDGFYARMLFGWPEEAHYMPLSDAMKEEDPELEETFLRLINLPQHEKPLRIPLSEEGRRAFEKFRERHHNAKELLEGRQREQWAKAQTHILRLAGTLAFMDWAMPAPTASSNRADFNAILKNAAEPSEIGLRFIAAAIRMWDQYFWPHALAAVRLMGTTDRHKNCRRALKWILSTGRMLVSRENLRVEAFARSLDAQGIDALIKHLERAGWLRPASVNKQGPGRPANRWEVNPILIDGTDAGNAANSANY